MVHFSCISYMSLWPQSWQGAWAWWDAYMQGQQYCQQFCSFSFFPLFFPCFFSPSLPITENTSIVIHPPFSQWPSSQWTHWETMQFTTPRIRSSVSVHPGRSVDMVGTLTPHPNGLFNVNTIGSSWCTSSCAAYPHSFTTLHHINSLTPSHPFTHSSSLIHPIVHFMWCSYHIFPPLFTCLLRLLW
jgi:hypothetical protein